MTKLINRYTLISLLGLISIFILVRYAKCKSNIDTTKKCKIELQREIKGVVDHFYVDNDINVKSFVILFSNGEKFLNPIFLKSLNGYIQEGDSIYKAPGTFTFEIYKKDKLKPIQIENVVKCDKL